MLFLFLFLYPVHPCHPCHPCKSVARTAAVFTPIQPPGGTLGRSQIRNLAMRAIRYLVVLSLLLSTAAFAGARDDLNAFTQGLKGLDGQFTQTVFDVNGKLKETSSGRDRKSTRLNSSP